MENITDKLLAFLIGANIGFVILLVMKVLKVVSYEEWEENNK